MRIFITGGSGYIGSAVVPRLVARGDDVHALARSDESATRVEEVGATSVRGEVTDTNLLREQAGRADAVVHLAAAEDRAEEIDRAAAAAMQEGLGDRGLYVHTGGIWSWGTTKGEVDELAPYDPPAMTAWRAGVEREVLDRGNAVLISPAVVYGRGGGLLPMVFGADEDGAAHYTGDGEHHCTLVHVDDIAMLYDLALGASPGDVYSGVAESLPAKEIAAAFGRPESETLEAAEQRLGPLAEAMALDQHITSRRARDQLGWRPEHLEAASELRAR